MYEGLFLSFGKVSIFEEIIFKLNFMALKFDSKYFQYLQLRIMICTSIYTVVFKFNLCKLLN